MSKYPLFLFLKDTFSFCVAAIVDVSWPPTAMRSRVGARTFPLALIFSAFSAVLLNKILFRRDIDMTMDVLVIDDDDDDDENDEDDE